MSAVAYDADLWQRASRLWEPPPNILLSDWMDKHFYLSGESSGQVGPWKTLPYQRGILDSMTDPACWMLSMKKSARVGYTKMLNGFQAYRMAVDPGNMLMVQPTVEDAEGYSKDEIESMLRDCVVLRDLVSSSTRAAKANTILRKEGPGFVWRCVGANSGRGFRRIHTRDVLIDECDAFPPSAGTEGDQVRLAIMRAFDAWDRKVFIGSTPLDKGSSRIEKFYEDSDQRSYYVPCPHCKNMQTLKWGGADKDYGMKWPAGCPSDAYYLCEAKRCRIEHESKWSMLERGEWIAARPDRTEHGHWGFFIWAAYSVAANAAWGLLAEEFLTVKKNPLLLKTFINTVLGEAWDDPYSTLDETGLAARREDLPTPIEVNILEDDRPALPDRALVITAGVDNQDNRFEITYQAWLDSEEVWFLYHRVMYCDPSTLEAWNDLDAELLRPWYRANGTGVEFVRGVGLDTRGHHTQKAYDFCGPRFRRATPDGGRQFVFACMGEGGPGTLWPKQPSKATMKTPLWPIRVDTAKNDLYGRLALLTPGPRYMHFSSMLPAPYFAGLVSEKRVTRINKKGYSVDTWEKTSPGIRNEPLDCAVYSLAALHGLYAMGFSLEHASNEYEQRRIVHAEDLMTPVRVAVKEEVSPRVPQVGAGGRAWISGRRGYLRGG